MREIESKFGGSDKGTLLVDMVAKDFSQGVVEDVRCSVIIS